MSNNYHQNKDDRFSILLVLFIFSILAFFTVIKNATIYNINIPLYIHKHLNGSWDAIVLQSSDYISLCTTIYSPTGLIIYNHIQNVYSVISGEKLRINITANNIFKIKGNYLLVLEFIDHCNKELPIARSIRSIYNT